MLPQRRVLSDVLRGYLVDGDADVRLVLLDRMRAAQKHRGRAHVILGPAGVFAAPRRDGCVREIADHVDAIAERRERLQRLRELERRALALRRPLVHRRAVRDVDASEARFRRRGRGGERRARGHHRFEQGQGERDTTAFQERSTRQMLFRDEHQQVLASDFLVLTSNFPELKRNALDDADDERREPVVGRRSHRDGADGRHVEPLDPTAQRVG